MRIRDEYYNNVASLSEVDPLHEQNVIRFRGRLWASVVPVTNVSVNVACEVARKASFPL